MDLINRVGERPQQFRISVKGDIVHVQEESDLQSTLGGQVRTLIVNLQPGAHQFTEVVNQAVIVENYLTAFGIYGVIHQHGLTFLVVITSVEAVALCVQSVVYKISQTKILGSPNATGLTAEQAKFAKLVQKAFDPKNEVGFGQQYLAYTYNLTLACQKQASTITERRPVDFVQSDSRFFWNRVLTQPLSSIGAQDFVIPCIQGFVETFTVPLPDSIVAPPKEEAQSRSTRYALDSDFLGCESATLAVTIMARRSVFRAGTRHWRRGADRDGNVANFVETEQITCLYPEQVQQAPSGQQLAPPSHVSAFLQVRGSIPLPWSQIPSLKYKPKTEVASEREVREAFRKHALEMLDCYPHVTAVNLANHHGSEGVLTSAFETEVAHFAQTAPQGSGNFRLISFDFHKECGASRYHNLAKLYVKLEADLHAFGSFTYTASSGSPALPPAQQQGVIRTNCIDCLDRTNVVQALLARRQLEAFLGAILLPGQGLCVDVARRMPTLDKAMRFTWADHGDAVSRHYAGTGALKSGFTRTGKRTLDGYADDGWKSAVRYYKNNFADGVRQDLIDLAVGRYAGQAAKAAVHYGDGQSPMLLLAVGLALLGYGIVNCVSAGMALLWVLVAMTLWLVGLGRKRKDQCPEVVVEEEEGQATSEEANLTVTEATQNDAPSGPSLVPSAVDSIFSKVGLPTPNFGDTQPPTLKSTEPSAHSLEATSDDNMQSLPTGEDVQEQLDIPLDVEQPGDAVSNETVELEAPPHQIEDAKSCTSPDAGCNDAGLELEAAGEPGVSTDDVADGDLAAELAQAADPGPGEQQVVEGEGVEEEGRGKGSADSGGGVLGGMKDWLRRIMGRRALHPEGQPQTEETSERAEASEDVSETRQVSYDVPKVEAGPESEASVSAQGTGQAEGEDHGGKDAEGGGVEVGDVSQGQKEGRDQPDMDIGNASNQAAQAGQPAIQSTYGVKGKLAEEDEQGAEVLTEVNVRVDVDEAAPFEGIAAPDIESDQRLSQYSEGSGGVSDYPELLENGTVGNLTSLYEPLQELQSVANSTQPVSAICDSNVSQWPEQLYVRFLGMHVVLPILIGALCVLTVLKGGKRFVNAPRLCPEDVKLW